MEIKKENLNSDYGYFYSVKEKITSHQSKYQKIEIIRTDEFGKVLLLDDVTQVGEKDHFQYHELITHPAMCMVENPQDVLIIGGGDGGVDREILRHSVRKIDHIELDEEVVRLCREHLPSISEGAFDDKRVEVIINDGRTFIENNRHLYNAIIMDLTDPFGPALKLYTSEFFQKVKESLQQDGVFSMHVESPTSQPELFSKIVATLKSVFPQVDLFYNYIKMYGCLWSIAVCSNGKKQIDGKQFSNILENRKINNLQLLEQNSFDAMQVTFPYIKNLLHKNLIQNPVSILTDKEISNFQTTSKGLMGYE